MLPCFFASLRSRIPARLKSAFGQPTDPSLPIDVESLRGRDAERTSDQHHHLKSTLICDVSGVLNSILRVISKRLRVASSTLVGATRTIFT